MADKKSFLNHDSGGIYEFWFRKEYKQLIFDKKLVSFVRPGVRLYPAPKGTKIGDMANVRILDLSSSVSPSGPVLSSYIARVIVKTLEIKKIGDMTPADFKGISDDASSQENVLTHLEKIYTRPFTKEDTVTVFRIEYITD